MPGEVGQLGKLRPDCQSARRLTTCPTPVARWYGNFLTGPYCTQRSPSASPGESFEILLEQRQNPLVFVGPTAGLAEAVVLHRVRRHAPILLAQFDEPLYQPHGVGELHVGI